MVKKYHKFGLVTGLIQGGCLAFIFLKQYINFELNTFEFRCLCQGVLPLSILLTKQLRGWNIDIIPNMLCTLLINLALLSTTNAVFFSYLALGAWILHLWAIKTFFYFKFIAPTGKFRVGYKNMDHQGFSFSVFYPTDKPTNVKAKFSANRHAMNNLYEGVTMRVPLPRWLFDMTFDFINKIKIHAYVGAPLISSEKLSHGSKKFVPIVFSHGLSAQRNAYSSFCCELASHGHIIFSIDHVEEIKTTFRDEKEGEIRRKFLAKRVKEVRALLDSLQQGGLLTDLFETQVILAFEKLVVMGHSFGGATALATSFEDKRVSDIILLDPWLIPFKKQEELTKKISSNVLLIESETWNKEEPTFEVTERNKFFIESQKGSGKRVLFTTLKGSDHISLTDITLLIAPVSKLAKQLSHLEKTRANMVYLVNLVREYVDLLVVNDNPKKSTENLDKLISSFNLS